MQAALRQALVAAVSARVRYAINCWRRANYWQLSQLLKTALICIVAEIANAARPGNLPQDRHLQERVQCGTLGETSGQIELVNIAVCGAAVW